MCHARRLILMGHLQSDIGRHCAFHAGNCNLRFRKNAMLKKRGNERKSTMVRFKLTSGGKEDDDMEKRVDYRCQNFQVAPQ
jgi:hypothetical protein